jgi:hypothetical protein
MELTAEEKKQEELKLVEKKVEGHEGDSSEDEKEEHKGENNGDGA